jgi:hypothetical protein
MIEGAVLGVERTLYVLSIFAFDSRWRIIQIDGRGADIGPFPMSRIVGTSQRDTHNALVSSPTNNGSDGRARM